MPAKKHAPRDPMSNLHINTGQFVNRICIGTPMTGLLRAEWVNARYGCMVPTNWSHVQVIQFMSSQIPLRYQVPDAQNIICKHVVEGDYEWLWLLEHDNILPNDAFMRINEYMIDKSAPVVSALYFTKSTPPEPLVYREVGFGYYADWKMGDKVWVREVPTGCLLIHGSIIKALWKESPEYMVNSNGGQIVTRRIFACPSRSWADPTGAVFLNVSGTSDLEWSKRIVRDNILAKAGWPEFQKKEFPFLVDTNLFTQHITDSGQQFPGQIPARFLRNGH